MQTLSALLVCIWEGPDEGTDWWADEWLGLGCVSRSAVMYYGTLISSRPCLFFLRRASATDNYHQFKLGHGAQCLHATKISCLHRNRTIKLSPSLCQTTKRHKKTV